MALCRHYVRELRRTNLFGTPELEKAGSKRSSTVLDNVTEAGPSNEKDKTTPEQRLSAFLRENDTMPRHSPQNSVGTTDSNRSNTDPPRPSFMAGSAADSSPMQDSSGNQQSTPDQHTVTRTDIRASAEKILYTYLLPGSEREIILPQSILDRITHDIEVDNRDDPEVFDTAKDYVFQAMERDAFPGFLRCKAFGNLVPPSMMVRLIIGLLAMFGGFWAAFTLIFLNHSRSNRCWVSLRSSHFIQNTKPWLTKVFCSSSFPSPSASTRWHRTSTCSTHSSSSPAAAKQLSAASARSANHSSRNYS
ncbi:Regulator of G protein signaling [Macrophomina phaseolina MS6]|uniref:Regulator of G protein signaling n=1 Tax=Macrophomina phaseolina (strain MS6) TaxID=1126212 RepID=K2SP72_MACPH|nr:Regulator of G protein signaling [Macrophomina phaseolina MS6]